MITTENIGGAVLLRTLTRKSVLWFGKFEGLKIQQIIDLRHQTYLRWIYYNCKEVTFLDDILSEITIIEDRRIVKPGTCPEKHNEVCDENLKKISFKSKARFNKLARVKKSLKEVGIERRAVASKSVMQACNLHRIKD